MKPQNERDVAIPEIDLIEDTEDFATDWLEPWALTDFADLIDEQNDDMGGVEVHPSKLAEFVG